MKRALSALLCALLPLLCGCSDGLDLSLMIISMGVDVTENGVVATIKAPDYTGKSAAGQDDGGGQEYLTLSAAGVDWPHALAALSGCAGAVPGRRAHVFAAAAAAYRQAAEQISGCDAGKL